ncbi:MAG: hypothetical protein WBA74_01250, partial [Cyclobacteriaceae bacterium]
MNSIRYIIVLLGVFLAICSCEEQIAEEPVATNTTIDTRFINTDSISSLSLLIDGATGNINALNELINSNQVIIDSLVVRISEEPENDQIALWESQIEKLTAINTEAGTALTPLQAALTLYANKLDSLNNGYANLLSIRNVQSGEEIELDTVVNLYPLPLDFTRTIVRYRIELEETTREIEITYKLNEEIDLSGITSLVIAEIEITDN